MNVYDLNGRTAVVTGGARGIGQAIAARLLAGGANVMLWDIDVAGLEAAPAALGSADRVDVAVADVTDPAAVEKARERTVERFGGIDILVNDAGVSGPTVKTWEYELEDWNHVVHVNLTGTFICCKSVVPSMMERGYGRIVNIASITGKVGSAGAPAYSAAKAGVIAFTKALAKEVVEAGVLVNCVTPAGIRTKFLEQLSEEHLQNVLSTNDDIPLGRLGKPEEVAHLVAWLCTEGCSFSTGAVFDLSGGRATY